MDTDRFDALARAVVAPRTRRGVVRRLVALPLAFAPPAMLGLTTTDAADHKQRRHKRQRRRNDRRDFAPGASGVCTWLDQLCSTFGNPCCDGATCSDTGVPFVTTCQYNCRGTGTTQEERDTFCQTKFKTSDVTCVQDVWACEGNYTGSTCCRPTNCTMRDRPCKRPGAQCCPSAIGGPQCCLPGQECTKHGCANST